MTTMATESNPAIRQTAEASVVKRIAGFLRYWWPVGALAVFVVFAVVFQRAATPIVGLSHVPDNVVEAIENRVFAAQRFLAVVGLSILLAFDVMRTRREDLRTRVESRQPARNRDAKESINPGTA